MTANLWVPPSAEPLLETRRQVDAERMALVAHMRDLLPITRQMNEELQRIDPLLELVFVGERAIDDDPAIIPGRWHLVRHCPNAPDDWKPITGAGGEYTEPTSRIFEKLAEGNMWNASHLRRQRQRDARDAAARERAKEAAREARREEMRDRVLAATRTQVSLTDARPWTQNTEPAAQREAGARAQTRDEK